MGVFERVFDSWRQFTIRVDMVMAGLDFKIKVDTKALDRVEGMFSTENLTHLTREIGFAVQEKTADHIARASVNRHKTADRLGAPHTKFLEFAPGRTTSMGAYRPKDGSPPPTAYSENADANGVTVVVANSPGLSRAFAPLVISAKRSPFLTIPINRVSYARSCAELRQEGWRIFRPKKGGKPMDILLGTNSVEVTKGRGKKRSTTTERQTIPLYVLKGQVTVPQDRGLMPLERDYQDWVADVVDAYVALNGGE